MMFILSFHRISILCCWLVSLFLASPQAFMFSKRKHNRLEFYQCTIRNALEDSSTFVVRGGEGVYLFYGIDTDILYLLFHLSFLVFAYFLPLIFLLINYLYISYLLQKTEFWPTTQNQTLNEQQDLSWRRQSQRQRSSSKNLRMCLVQVGSGIFNLRPNSGTLKSIGFVRR